MKHAARLTVGAAVALAGALAMACQNGVTGPSLSATIQTISLSPTVKLPAGENICCCHVVGTVKNNSSVTAHIRLEFTAKKDGGTIGQAMVLEKEVGSGAVRSFEAPGMFAPCSSIDTKQILADAVVRVIGLWEPI